jgi:replicative DNA helicase
MSQQSSDGWRGQESPRPSNPDAIRVPPHNDEAERSTLGAALIDNRIMDDLMGQLQPESFYRESHRHIWRCMCALHMRGDAIDVITLADQLQAEQLLDAVGGPNVLARLSSEVPSSANVNFYAQIVKRKSALRAFIATAHALIDECYEDVADFDAFMDGAERQLFAITQSGAPRGYQSMREVIKEAFAQIESLYQKAEQVTGVSSGFADLDEITAGWQRSDLVIIAARPAMGKCLTADAQLVLRDGSVKTIEQIVAAQQAELLTLDDKLKLGWTAPSVFVDDGIKPVWRVTTRSGRTISATASHPLLTIHGWRPVHELQVGEAIAAPRHLPVFGTRAARPSEIALTAYLLGDGGLTGSSPCFTQKSEAITRDFTRWVDEFGGVEVSPCRQYEGKTPIYRIVKAKPDERRLRAEFKVWLDEHMEREQLTSAALAQQLHISAANISVWRNARGLPGYEVLERGRATVFRTLPAPLFHAIRYAHRRAPNPLVEWLTQHQLWGKDAHHKHIPEFIFTLPREQLAFFLNRLFATDGWITTLGSGQVQIGYGSASEQLIRQLAHLLLRFGVIGHLSPKQKKTKRRDYTFWQLHITHQDSLQTFVEAIGIFQRSDNFQLQPKESSSNFDNIPAAIWRDIEVAKGAQSWASLALSAFGVASSNLHAHKRGISRPRLLKIADALKDQRLADLAKSDVFWDEITAIEPLGAQQVYDLTIPQTHNFVANDLCVHNTSFCLNMATHAAIERDTPVAFFSLEMANVQLAIRMLCCEGRIDQSKLRTGRMSEQEWARLIKAAGALSEAKIFLDDTPALPIMEFRSKARKLKSEHDIGMIIIDYLQLMKAPGKNVGSREQEIGEISRNLKGIAKELSIPILALAQLNRGVEQRADKRPMNSDLRESGSIEQDADIIGFIYRDEVYNPDSEDKGIAEFILGKHRNGSLGTVRLRFFGEYTRFENLAPDME